MNHRLERLVGSGATADVYEYGKGKVIKLYKQGSLIDSVQWEYGKALSVCESILSAPKVYELIEKDNRYGIVMEQVRGETLNSIINESMQQLVAGDISLEAFAEQILTMVRITAQSLHDLHSMKPSKDFETMDTRLKRDVNENQFLTAKEKNDVISIIESLPKGNSVCHGDPNPYNILVNDDHYRFIDWVNAGIGNPMYDIAEYILLSTPNKKALENLPAILVDFFERYGESISRTFLTEYEKLSEIDTDSYKDWQIPLLVSKLNSNRTMEEKEQILENIRERIRNKKRKNIKVEHKR
ncbi:MAG TPA: aminoglycoside phosphotransferase family protein [Lachnospiraceae bacterium]|nr:aminoglycoside phosphotransferase family protein [Lachnospiraceae bacterium]